MLTHIECSKRITAAIVAGASLAMSSAMAATEPAQSARKTPQKLHLKLDAKDLDAVIAKHRANVAVHDDQLEQVIVVAPTELLPMRSDVHDAWSGALAPVWAALHPTQSWRIFLPIPSE